MSQQEAEAQSDAVYAVRVPDGWRGASDLTVASTQVAPEPSGTEAYPSKALGRRLLTVTLSVAVLLVGVLLLGTAAVAHMTDPAATDGPVDWQLGRLVEHDRIDRSEVVER